MTSPSSPNPLPALRRPVPQKPAPGPDKDPVLTDNQPESDPTGPEHVEAGEAAPADFDPQPQARKKGKRFVTKVGPGRYSFFEQKWLTFSFGKVMPAFWTISAIVSLIVNIILIAILLGLGRELFQIKALVGDGLLGGLYSNFQKMDDAHIVTTIQVEETIVVNDSIVVKFDLPISQDTIVVLTADTPIDQVPILLNGVWVPTPIILPQGTELGINLEMTVPVETVVPVTLNVPVQLNVPVDIAMDQTELHEPFVGLQDVIGPYYQLSSDMPSTWEDICGPSGSWFCRWLFSSK